MEQHETPLWNHSQISLHQTTHPGPEHSSNPGTKLALSLASVLSGILWFWNSFYFANSMDLQKINPLVLLHCQLMTSHLLNFVIPPATATMICHRHLKTLLWEILVVRYGFHSAGPSMGHSQSLYNVNSCEHPPSSPFWRNGSELSNGRSLNPSCGLHPTAM